ncbi:MAG: Glu/Leu/Phe/Val dehydrogenase [Flavobacteriaceae bacterium]|nr:Glu/Leu/Phe/Val dehydrogenase [Flavobacteriaceae bacterium]
MRALLQKFEEKSPEIVFHWRDSETEAEGWTVINSLRGGAAGGGTRMRVGLDQNEVLSLAKTMEVKFTVSGPPIGGAKSGINFDPHDPRKKGVLQRWYRAVSPLLKSYYGTGGDMNVDELNEVIPITEESGVYYDIYGGNIKGKRAIIQGFGNVASAAAYYLAQSGAIIVGIIDRAGGIIDESGLSFDQVKALFLNKNGNALAGDNLLSFEEVNARIWSISADIFAPCAASRLISQDQIQSLIDSGLKVVSSGANVPFADKEIFFGPIMESTDRQISLIPDFISNCGMARVFSYFMEKRVIMTDEAIFEDVSNTIRGALERVHKQNKHAQNISATAFEIALNQLI